MWLLHTAYVGGRWCMVVRGGKLGAGGPGGLVASDKCFWVFCLHSVGQMIRWWWKRGTDSGWRFRMTNMIICCGLVTYGLYGPWRLLVDDELGRRTCIDREINRHTDKNAGLPADWTKSALVSFGAPLFYFSSLLLLKHWRPLFCSCVNVAKSQSIQMKYVAKYRNLDYRRNMMQLA